MLIFFIFLGLLPSLAWLVFFLKEDVHPEPKKMIAKVFLVGALATFIVLQIQLILRDEILKNLSIAQYSSITFLFLAATEEIFKFLAVYLVVRKSKFFDEPIDAMIYMITAALGFAMIENIAVLSSIALFSEAISIIVLRFVGATLLHALSSAIVGYYWAKGIILSSVSGVKKNVWIFIFQGLVLASLLHTIFNYLILKEVMIYSILFLITIALFVFWDFERLKAAH